MTLIENSFAERLKEDLKVAGNRVSRPHGDDEFPYSPWEVVAAYLIELEKRVELLAGKSDR